MVPGKGSSPAPSLWSQVRNSLVEEWQVPEEKTQRKKCHFCGSSAQVQLHQAVEVTLGANVKQLAHPFAAKAVTANLGRGRVSGCFSPTMKKDI